MDLLVVDLNTVFYNTVVAYDKLPSVYKLSEVNELTFLQILSGAVFGSLPVKEFQVIFLLDKKPYWRAELLNKKGVNYKGKRNKNPMYELQINALRSFTNEILIEFGVAGVDLYSSTPVKGTRVGYEADDLAAGVVKQYASIYQRVWLLTTDSDWLPFTYIPNVIWLNVTNYFPRVRNAQIGLEWCKAHKQLNSTKLRRAFVWESIRSLWAHKIRFGDGSDNIRGNYLDQSAHKYDQFIDLMNPPIEFMCWNEENFNDLVETNLTQPQRKMSDREFVDLANGTPTTLTSYEEKDFVSYGLNVFA